MNTYFITGGLGFLGQYIVQALCQYDHQAQVRVLVRTPRRTYLGVESLPQVQLHYGNLKDPASYAAGLAGAGTVIHNAALVSFRKNDRRAILDANIAGTRDLIQSAARQGCQNFIYISSISAIGICPGQLSDEGMVPQPQDKLNDPYGYSKLLGEFEVQKFADHMRVVILNPSVIIGPASARINSILRVARIAPFIPMLPTINSFVDVRDVARSVLLALDHGHSGERYIVTAWNINMLEFTRLTLQKIGRHTPVFPISPRLAPLGDMVVVLLDRLHLNPGIRKISDLYIDKAYSNEKIFLEMGWEPHISLEQSLVDTLHPLKQ